MCIETKFHPACVSFHPYTSRAGGSRHVAHVVHHQRGFGYAPLQRVCRDLHLPRLCRTPVRLVRRRCHASRTDADRLGWRRRLYARAALPCLVVPGHTRGLAGRRPERSVRPHFPSDVRFRLPQPLLRSQTRTLDRLPAGRSRISVSARPTRSSPVDRWDSPSPGIPAAWSVVPPGSPGRQYPC